MTLSKPSIWTLLSVTVALFILLVARSDLSPKYVSTYAPILAVILMIVISLPIISRLRIPRDFGLVGAFGFVFVCSTLASGDPNKSLQAMGITALWLVAFLCGANIGGRYWNFFLWLLIIVGISETFIAVGETLFANEWIRAVVASDTSGLYFVRQNEISSLVPNRAQGTIGYPIPFSHFISISLITVLATGIIRKIGLRILIALILCLGLILSGTRTSILAVALAVIILLFLTHNSRKVIIKSVLFLAGIPITIITIWDYFSAEATSGDYSFIHRLGVIASLGRIVNSSFIQFFVGSGYNSHEALFERGTIPGLETFAVDNAFVSIVISSGLIGLAFFVLLLIRTMLRKDRHVIAIMILAIIYGFSYDFIYWHLLMFLTVVFMGRAFGQENDVPDGLEIPHLGKFSTSKKDESAIDGP